MTEDPITKQGKLLRKLLPIFGNYMKRRFGEKHHKGYNLGGPEQLDDFIKHGYIGTNGDYNRAGVWRFYHGVKMDKGYITMDIKFIVNDFS